MYHFGATLVVTGLVLWMLFGVQLVKNDTSCNQGMLAMHALKTYDEQLLLTCPIDLQRRLKEKFNIPSSTPSSESTDPD